MLSGHSRALNGYCLVSLLVGLGTLLDVVRVEPTLDAFLYHLASHPLKLWVRAIPFLY